MAVQETTVLPAMNSTASSYSQAPIMMLQLMSQLHALNLVYTAVNNKCQAAAERVEQERKRRSRDRALCDEREEELMSQLLEQKKLVYAASKDQQWSQELMVELENRYNESEQVWQEKLDTCEKTEQNATEQIQILQEERQKIADQLKDNRIQAISQCPTEKQVLIEEKNTLTEALRLLDSSVKNDMLLRAARNGNAAAVKGLIRIGADINVKDSSDNYRRTPLHWAAVEGHVEVMKALIALGADPRTDVDKYMDTVHDVDSGERTLLHSAARYGRPNAVRYLLDGKWVSIEALTPGINNTALYFASRYGHTEVVNMLLAAGANIDAVNFRGTTPLHTAAFNGRKLSVITLVNHGASLTLSDNDGNAYQNARSEGHYDIAEFIKSKMS